MNKKQFSIHLLNWYKKNKRDLPWRNTKDPYAIWLSEIILQQTRVAQGMDYYLRFLAKYPNIQSFASASEDEVMKLWQGLGYYSRARYMMSTAKEIVTSFDGKFPSSYGSLIKLKGIGAYTAAAIASISFNEPVSAVDGNVLRVFSRFAGIMEPIDKPEVRKFISSSLDQLMDKTRPADFNQAMIELGALCCTPRSPGCNLCPLLSGCYAAQYNIQENLPVKKPKTLAKSRYFHYLMLELNNNYLIHKRAGKDIWNSLYEFPLIETSKEIKPELLLAMKEIKEFTGTRQIEILKITGPFKHQLSHQTIFAYFYKLRLKGKNYAANSEYISVSRESLGEYAFPRLIDRYLEEDDILDSNGNFESLNSH